MPAQPSLMMPIRLAVRFARHSWFTMQRLHLSGSSCSGAAHSPLAIHYMPRQKGVLSAQRETPECVRSDAPMALRKCSMRTSVFFTSDEYTSEPTIGQKGTCSTFEVKRFARELFTGLQYAGE